MVSPRTGNQHGRMSSSPRTMRALRFHRVGEPGEVLELGDAPIPQPAADRICVAVHACGLNPADWALCRGLFAGTLPRGIGLDVAGTVHAIGTGVTDVSVGDRVAGMADFAGSASAGAADFAILDHWALVPESIDFVDAAALPMAIETAALHLHAMDLAGGKTVMIHAAGTTIGFAAVQIALLHGAKVIATAGETYTERLRGMGASVTSYGEGMLERARALSSGPVDAVLDTSPVAADPKLVHKFITGDHASLPEPSVTLLDLVRAAGGDARRVVTISNISAAKIGVRTSFDLLKPGDSSPNARAKILRTYIGKVTVPIARTYPLDDWRSAMAASIGGNARGKLVLLPRSR